MAKRRGGLSKPRACEIMPNMLRPTAHRVAPQKHETGRLGQQLRWLIAPALLSGACTTVTYGGPRKSRFELRSSHENRLADHPSDRIKVLDGNSCRRRAWFFRNGFPCHAAAEHSNTRCTRLGCQPGTLRTSAAGVVSPLLLSTRIHLPRPDACMALGRSDGSLSRQAP